MNVDNFIPIDQLCSHYHIELTFFNALSEEGLIEVETVQSVTYVHRDQIAHLERLIRLHQELELNIEGIDIALHLLNKIEYLQQELQEVRTRLYLYEGGPR
ncbi:MerR-like DNA binding protein [Dyadobacter jejuensis]|uniref:MerR-like DNA binding protein n=1 Tax=Dyadobacter jejuensis TaxID=1082580 RepID=A0A316AP90_9BACT|nr:chaperone modulator CbpM [Dyadobacter jejuensis]PWJ59605.1 MerR-like DNA binding protein [Dyadobacter jejuensis]